MGADIDNNAADNTASKSAVDDYGAADNEGANNNIDDYDVGECGNYGELIAALAMRAATSNIVMATHTECDDACNNGDANNAHTVDGNMCQQPWRQRVCECE